MFDKDKSDYSVNNNNSASALGCLQSSNEMAGDFNNIFA